MSKMGWRWFGVSKSGAVQSFFGDKSNPWPTDGPYHAECNRSAFMQPSQYSHSIHEAEVRLERAQALTDPNEAVASLKNEVPMDKCPRCTTGHDHQIADLECSCGIYVFRWSEDAAALPYVGGYRSQCEVFGVVEWWGHYSEHELGYRVEWAQLRAIHAWGKGTKVHPAYQIDRVQKIDDLIARYEPEYDDDEATAH